MNKKKSALALAAIIILLGAIIGFSWYITNYPYPQDPNQTLEKVQGTVLRVGVTENPPFVIENKSDGLDGIEIIIIEAFADSIDARVVWEIGSEQVLIDKLKKYELQVVAGGLRTKSPWGKHATLTRPYKNELVMAVPKGENRFLYELETFLHDQRQPIDELFATYDLP